MSISKYGAKSCHSFTRDKEILLGSYEEQTQPKYQEIVYLIHRIRENFPTMDIFRAVQILYCRLKSSGNVQHQEEVEKENIDFKRPQFQIRQTICKSKFMPSSEANQRPQQRFQNEPNNKKVTAQKWSKHDSDDNFKRCLLWGIATPSKTYRFYTSKVTPKFNNEEQQERYYQKRLAAQAFCNRGYGLNKVKEQFYKINGDAYEQGLTFCATNNHPPNGESSLIAVSAYRFPDKKRYKVVSTSIISEALRRLQMFIMEKVDKTIRPFTGSQMRSLFSHMLNSKDTMPTEQYVMFCRFIKVTFDLGSVSICEQTTKRLYYTIQLLLNSQISGSLIQQSSNKNLISTEINAEIQKYNKLKYRDIYQFY